jgi:UDP-N-acetylglucosamine acyltransferase
MPPYVRAAGNMAQPYGINSVGLRRRGLPATTIEALKRAYKTVYRSGLGLEETKTALQAQAAGCPEVAQFLSFINASKRGLIR